MRIHTCYVCVFFLQDQDKEYVGFATLPNQVHRKTVKKGFTFTLMVAGQSSSISAYWDLIKAVIKTECNNTPVWGIALQAGFKKHHKSEWMLRQASVDRHYFVNRD